MASISHDDTNAVVIVGSGAGGGTLAHELTRRGVKVVLLEAGARQSLSSFSQVPGEAFAQHLVMLAFGKIQWPTPQRVVAAACNGHSGVWPGKAPENSIHGG